MAADVQWTGDDPETGEKRFYKAEFFARRWTFALRTERRGVWKPIARPSRALWEILLESLERRHPRGHASDISVEVVRKIVAEFREPPEFDGTVIGESE